MSKVEFIRNWVKAKKGRYSDLSSLYGSEIVYAIKDEKVRPETISKIMKCIKTIEDIECGKIKKHIDRKDTCYTKKDKFFDYFSNDPSKINEFKAYSRHLIDIDAILDGSKNYSSYIHTVFLNFIDGKDHPLKKLYDILESDKEAETKMNKIYKTIYGGTNNYFSRQILVNQSFRGNTLKKIDKLVKMYI